MGQWQRIWDHEFAGYGRRSITFASPDGAYHVHVDDEDQNGIRVQRAGREVRWGIEVKEVRGGTFRLSGMALGAGDFLGGGFWYELTLTSPSTISYWGNRVLEREDREV